MIVLASDHGGYALKENIKARLTAAGYTIQDFGVHDAASADYPDLVAPAARAVAAGEGVRGILVCTTGIGASIAANKISGVRCALCTAPEMAELSRRHNDSNILALGAQNTDAATALALVDVWLKTEFDGGRHARRVDKIMALEGAKSEQ